MRLLRRVTLSAWSSPDTIRTSTYAPDIHPSARPLTHIIDFTVRVMPGMYCNTCVLPLPYGSCSQLFREHIGRRIAQDVLSRMRRNPISPAHKNAVAIHMQSPSQQFHQMRGGPWRIRAVCVPYEPGPDICQKWHMHGAPRCQPWRDGRRWLGSAFVQSAAWYAMALTYQ